MSVLKQSFRISRQAERNFKARECQVFCLKSNMSLRVLHNFNEKDQNILKLLDLKFIAFLSVSGDVRCTSSSRDTKHF